MTNLLGRGVARGNSGGIAKSQRLRYFMTMVENTLLKGLKGGVSLSSSVRHYFQEKDLEVLQL